MDKFFGPMQAWSIPANAISSMKQTIDATVGTSAQAHNDAVGYMLGKTMVQTSQAHAAAITNRLDTVSANLQHSIKSSGDNITNAISDSADQISSSVNLQTVLNAAGFAAVTIGVLAVRKAVKENTAVLHEISGKITEKFNELIWLAQKQLEGTEKIYDLLRHSQTNEAVQLLEQGERNYTAGFYDDARERFEKALQFDNTLFPLHRNLGMILVHEEKFDQAEAHLKKALAFAKEKEANSLALIDLARFYNAKGDSGLAGSYYQQALATSKSPKLLYELAIFNFSSGNKDEALRYLREAIELDPSLWNIAAIDPEFDSNKKEVYELLDSLYREKARNVQDNINYILSIKNTINKSDENDDKIPLNKLKDEVLLQLLKKYQDILNDVISEIDNIVNDLNNIFNYDKLVIYSDSKYRNRMIKPILRLSNRFVNLKDDIDKAQESVFISYLSIKSYNEQLERTKTEVDSAKTARFISGIFIILSLSGVALGFNLINSSNDDTVGGGSFLVLLSIIFILISLAYFSLNNTKVSYLDDQIKQNIQQCQYEDINNLNKKKEEIEIIIKLKDNIDYILALLK
jgi:tetratricopeptide (TPR) repeat protein